VHDRTHWTRRIEAAWQRRPLVWLTGVRRSGKTVLCRSLRDVEYLDCELPSVRRAVAEPEAFLRSLGTRRVVLDEVHRLDDPSQLLKIATDHFPKVQLVASGSSTLQASRKFRDTLTGRKVEVLLTPMMSADLVAFNDTNLVHRLGRGGLPPFFLCAELIEADFQEWMDSYWARDIQELFRLNRRGSFLRFVELLLVQSGGLFDASKLATPCEVSRPTIASYLNMLELTRVAHVLRPFAERRRSEIVATPKVYGFDTGLVAYYRGWRDLHPSELGQLWEHYVLNELQARLPQTEIRYWRDTRHHEVDFVLAPRGRAPIAIECKWTADGRDDLPGLAAFRRAYPQGPSFVVAPSVTRAFTRHLGRDEIAIDYVNLETLVERLLATRT